MSSLGLVFGPVEENGVKMFGNASLRVVCLGGSGCLLHHWSRISSGSFVLTLFRVFVLTLFIFKAPNYVLARTLTERVV